MKKRRTLLCIILTLAVFVGVLVGSTAGSSAAGNPTDQPSHVTVGFCLDGEIIRVAEVAYGSTPTYKGETVITGNYFQYEILDWLPAFAPVTKNTLYDACYVKTLRTDVGEKGFLRGDANGDGDVNILDATAIQRYLAGLYSDPEGIIHVLGACDGDKVTILDATRIQRFLAGFSNDYGIEQPITWSVTVIPETPPTAAFTEAPTEAATEAPTEAATEAATTAPTVAPTEAPTEAPTLKPAPTDPYELPPI